MDGVRRSCAQQTSITSRTPTSIATTRASSPRGVIVHAKPCWLVQGVHLIELARHGGLAQRDDTVVTSDQQVGPIKLDPDRAEIAADTRMRTR